MNYEMKITLKSDLCSASGDGFSLTIDTDVCYDKYGFPIIPSRRLKGCMLEAANYIGADNVKEIFGTSGSEKGGSLRIGNAVLENYDSLKAQAKNSHKNAQQILSLFTSVRASTAIENDTAKPESLRFMRAVNHYSPLDSGELAFVAQVEADEKYFPQLEKICRAVRNIGYKRNRGFGSVRCSLYKADSGSPFSVKGDISDNEKEYEIRFTVLTNSPVMIPGAKSDETEDYIPGTAVMGHFAKKYLETHKPDGDFEELFLKNNVIFSNLYIVSEDGIAAVPAPSAIAKDKTEDGQPYVNMLSQEQKDKQSYVNTLSQGQEEDRILKPLKSGYFTNDKEIKVNTETLYHHSEDGNLYTQTCISEGQVFGGTISGKGKFLREINDLFGDRKIAVGRSKSAQYAECTIVSAEVRERTEELTEFAPNEKIAAVFCSDAIFVDEYGNYSTKFGEVCGQLGITSPDDKLSFMKYKTVMGYMAAGRYKKPHIRAVKAGSTICFTAKEPVSLPTIKYFGEKIGEGFGMVRFVKADQIKTLGETFFFVENNSVTTEDGALCSLLDKNEKREEMRSEAINYAKENSKTICGLNSSFIGRVHLMTRQAKDYDDLMKRIKSVKADDKREPADEIARTAEKYKESGMWREYLEIIFLLGKYFLRGKSDETNIL